MATEHLRDGAVPKHEQLRRILLSTITREMAPGDLLASERALMAEFGVSRITVREAIGQLVNEGHLVRVRGKGTFVAQRRVQSTLHLASFTEEMRAMGHEPMTVVLAAETVTAPEATAQALGLPAGARAHHVKRLRLADGAPVSVDDGWYHPELYPGLPEVDLSGSIYDAAAQVFGHPIDRAEQTAVADPAPDDIAVLLGIVAGAPVLHFDRVSFSRDRPAEHTHSWYRSDRYQLRMTVSASD